MGYRHYFHSVPKTQIEEIKNCKTINELCNWAESAGYKVDRNEDERPYFPVRTIGKEIYGFGKYVDWALEMQDRNESIFNSDELKEKYEHYQPVICTQDDFILAINEYKQKIINYYKGLLDEQEIRGLTKEQRQQGHIESQLEEWNNEFNIYPIDLNLNRESITGSWLYEYAIFELVRVYKTFNWENDVLVLLGW